MTDAEKSMLGTMFFNGLLLVIPLVFTLIAGGLGWAISRIRSQGKEVENTAKKLDGVMNGEGIEKIVAVVTRQQQEGKIPLGTVAQKGPGENKVVPTIPPTTEE